jgi:hypothetical protein
MKQAARGTGFLFVFFLKVYDTGEMFFPKNRLTFSELQNTKPQKSEIITKQSNFCEANIHSIHKERH